MSESLNVVIGGENPHLCGGKLPILYWIAK
jgi:hypothetical protein